jgi:hypothetical protein
VTRINNDRTLKNIFNTKPEGVRSVERLKLQREDGVNQDVKTLRVRNWKNAFLERDEWTQILKKARTH